MPDIDCIEIKMIVKGRSVKCLQFGSNIFVRVYSLLIMDGNHNYVCPRALAIAVLYFKCFKNYMHN